MRLNDVALYEPGEALPLGPTGDLSLVSGLDSLELWAPRAIATPPGALLHRPAFGGGVERHLGRANSLGSLVADVRATLQGDRRVTSARVQAQASATSPGHVEVSAEVVTADEQPGQLRMEF